MTALQWMETLGSLAVGWILGGLIIRTGRFIYRVFWAPEDPDGLLKYMVFLTFVDALFGPALRIAPRCWVCQRVRWDLEPCRLKHRDPEDQIRGCGSEVCRDCHAKEGR